MKKLLVLGIVLAGVSLIAYLFYREGTLAVNPQDTTSKIFVIQKGDNIDTITRKLANEGFIRSRIVFYAVLKQKGFDKKIQAGDFRLSASMNSYTIAEALTHGTLDNWITIIEGLRKEEIAQRISKEFDIPEQEFIKAASEGFLFPDTYLIPRDATVQSIIKVLTDNFNKKYSSEIQGKGINLGLTKEQIVTLASIVEKEARGQDRIQVASILLKRLKSDWPLQADATVQYALGYQSNAKTWWKKDLTIDDLAIDSPYNTYKNKGLPAGPICNPGLASLIAVVSADVNTPYFFYLHDSQGTAHYARTIEEHNANVKKYIK